MRTAAGILGAFLSLLTGCVEKPSPAPRKPGVSVALRYPVLLIGERDLRVKNDEASLISTTVASGGEYYASYAFVDSDGIEYELRKATAFGRKSVWLDMGTSPYQVFLELKKKSKLSLATAKSRARAVVADPLVATGVDRASTFPEPIEACR